jgi:hypothetical protein
MVSRYNSYKLERGDNLADPAFWNPRLQDIDNRITARELDKEKIDDAVDVLEAVALQRLNDTFTPLIVEAQQRLNNLGASFSGESLDSETIGLGVKIFTLTEATAANYVFTDYVNIRTAITSGGGSMLGQVVSFDRGTGNLTVNVVHVEGSGTFADWLIRVGAPLDLTHADRTDNPHQTTAAQVGAYTTTQTDAAVAAAIAAIPDLPDFLQGMTDAPATRTLLGLKALATQDTVSFAQIAPTASATPAQIRSATADKIIQPDDLFAAAGYVALTPASPITLDLNNGFNFYITLDASRTLALPVNQKMGQSGLISVWQPAGGGCSLGFASGYVFDQGVVPTLDLSGGRHTQLYYHCHPWGVSIAVAFKGAR